MVNFTLLFMLFAAFMVWTYSVMPDVMETVIAFQTGVERDLVIKLWVIALIGIVIFFIIFYTMGRIPA